MAQSRKRCLDDGSDNAGFAAWVRKDATTRFFAAQREGLIVYGEWAGPGVQKGDAVGELKQRIFCIFALADVGDAAALLDPDASRAITVEPEAIRERLEADANAPLPEDVFVLPWHADTFELTLGPLKARVGDDAGAGAEAAAAKGAGDAEDEEAAIAADPDLAALAAARKAASAAALEALNAQVEAIGRRDPWVSATFGVEGTGEGLVLNPVAIDGQPLDTVGAYGHFAFKAKAEHHAVKVQARPAQVDTPKAKSARDFAAQMVTPVRCRQGVDEACGGSVEMKRMGAFLKWVGRDVQKEGVAELETAGLEWKDVKRVVNDVAKQWFVQAAQSGTL